VSKRLLNWLATTDDLRRVASDLEPSGLVYVESRWRPLPLFGIYTSLTDSPRFGGHDTFYVVSVETRIYQRQGSYTMLPSGEWGQEWRLDGERMPDAVVMILPRILPDTKVLLDGQLIAMTNSPVAIATFKAIVAAIKKSHTRRGNGLIGPEAWALAQQGWRPCHDPGSPPEYDIDLGMSWGP
jgi:hypothetical protein